jgi:hypothetical protein
MFGQKSTPAYTNEVNEVGRIVVEERMLENKWRPLQGKETVEETE